MKTKPKAGQSRARAGAKGGAKAAIGVGRTIATIKVKGGKENIKVDSKSASDALRRERTSKRSRSVVGKVSKKRAELSSRRHN